MKQKVVGYPTSSSSCLCKNESIATFRFPLCTPHPPNGKHSDKQNFKQNYTKIKNKKIQTEKGKRKRNSSYFYKPRIGFLFLIQQLHLFQKILRDIDNIAVSLQG